MKFFIGLIVVLGAVMGGYLAAGGHAAVLFQPFEFLIIGGAGIGAFVIGNSGRILKAVLKGFGSVIKGSKYKKPHYLELLTLLYQVSKLVKSKGVLAIEKHVEHPHESTLFSQFPTFYKDHHAVDFLCDYLRLWTLGTNSATEMEDLLNTELDTHHAEEHQVSHALQTLADSFPALGIVAAVLGVIHTMGSITEPPEVLGHLIGGALVGTFFGILVCYGIVGPMAAMLGNVQESESKYLTCIKTALMAHMQGYAPAVVVEFARKSLNSDMRPTFAEVEEAVSALPPPA